MMRSIKNQSARWAAVLIGIRALALVAAVSVAACSGFRAAACGGQKVGRPRMEHLSRPVSSTVISRHSTILCGAGRPPWSFDVDEPDWERAGISG